MCEKIKQPIYNHFHASEHSCLKTTAFLPCQCLDAFFCQSQCFQQCGIISLTELYCREVQGTFSPTALAKDTVIYCASNTVMDYFNDLH